MEIYAEGTHKCSTCLKLFQKKSNLVRHLRVHTGERPYVCSVCDKPYKSSSSLVNHMKIHSDETPYKCSICGKEFKTKAYLNAHLMLHADKRPYGCSICDKSFSYSSRLADHMKTHSDETPYKCTDCDKSYKRKRDLTAHMKVPCVYSCTLCYISYSRSNKLADHMKRHSKETSHQCMACLNFFQHKQALNRHLRLSLCQKTFSNRDSLSYHMRDKTQVFLRFNDSASHAPQETLPSSNLSTTGDNEAGDKDDPISRRPLDSEKLSGPHNAKAPYILNVKIEEDI